MVSFRGMFSIRGMGLNITQLLGINLQIFEGDVKPIPKGDIYQPPQGKFGGMEKESRHTAIGIAAGQVCDRIMGGIHPTVSWNVGRSRESSALIPNLNQQWSIGWICIEPTDNMYVYIYIFIYMDIYIYDCVCIYIYTYVCMYVRTYVRTYVRRYIYNTYVCMYIYIYIYIYIYTHVYIYI